MKTFSGRTLALACAPLLSALAFFIFNATPVHAGTLDPTFDSDGRATVHIGQYCDPKKVFVLPDGKILVAGETAQAGYHFYAPSPMMARFNSDGTLDTTFGINGIVPGQFGNVRVEDVLLQPDGKIVFIGGANPLWNMGPADFAVVRYNSNGTLDNTFGVNGVVVTSIGGSRDSAYAGVLLPDGKILAIGGTLGTETSPGALDLVRYNSNGTLDSTFGDGGVIYHLHGPNGDAPNFTDLILLPNGNLLANGQLLSYYHPAQNFIARLNADGSFDNTFGSNGFVYSDRAKGLMTLKSDGTFIIANSFLNGNFTFELTRFKDDGSIDTNFGTNGVVQTRFRAVNSGVGNMDANVSQIALKSNGDIVAIGWGVETSYLSYLIAALYNSNGSLIAKTAISFPPLTEARGTTAAIQPDGKIVLAGMSEFPTGNDVAVARLTNITNNIRPYKKRYNFIGTMADNITVYRPGTGGDSSAWYNFSDQYISPQFGISGDIIAPSDYNDDGIADLAVFRPSNGTWYIANNFYNATYNFTAIQWGTSGDIPAPADYDGDGRADVAVFRPSTGFWYILNSQTNSATIVQWGISGDKPAVGDYDGDGKADVAVFRPGNGFWYILKSTDNQLLAIQFGVSTDIPVQGDYNGDYITDVAVFRPATGTWFTSTNPAINYGAVQFGVGTDIPVPGDFDGDNKTDLAVWRPATRTWYILRSSDGAVSGTQWGATTDTPVPGN